jgi:hypothetical protein
MGGGETYRRVGEGRVGVRASPFHRAGPRLDPLVAGEERRPNEDDDEGDDPFFKSSIVFVFPGKR